MYAHHSLMLSVQCSICLFFFRISRFLEGWSLQEPWCQHVAKLSPLHPSYQLLDNT